MMRRRLSSCFQAQRPEKTGSVDDSNLRDFDTYIRVTPKDDHSPPGNASGSIVTGESSKEGGSPPTCTTTGKTKTERLAQDVDQEQEELSQGTSAIQGSESGNEEQTNINHNSELKKADGYGDGEDDECFEIEPEWTILDPDELTNEYSAFVKLSDLDQNSSTDSQTLKISGSWEILYNMAAAEIDIPEVGGELEMDLPDHPVAGGHVEDHMRNSEDDEVDKGAVSSEDPGSAKRKKFKPWKSLRNLFKKVVQGKEVEADESLGVKSKSTGELNRSDIEENEAEGNGTPSTSLQSPSLAKGISVSEDSVFSPEKPAPTKEEVQKSAEMNMSSAFTNELSAKLKGRSGSDEVTEKVAQEKPVARTPEPKAFHVPPKPAPRSREKRRSTGISIDDEISTRQRKPPKTKPKRWKSFSVASQEKTQEPKRESKEEPETKIPIKPLEGKGSDSLDLDLIVSTSLLENTAARHRISVAPRARRATTRPGQRTSKRPATTHDVIPKTTATPSELAEPDLKRPNSAPLTTTHDQCTKPTSIPPPLPTTPIPSKRASTLRGDGFLSDDNKSSTIPRVNAIPQAKQPPPIKLPRPPSLGPMVLPPIQSTQSLRSNLRHTPPRSKSLGETPSEDLCSQPNGNDESQSLESQRHIAETDRLLARDMLTPAQPNSSPVSQSVAVAKPLLFDPDSEQTQAQSTVPNPNTVTAEQEPKDLINLETDSGGPGKDEPCSARSSAKNSSSPFLSELGTTLLKRSHRSQTVGSCPTYQDIPVPIIPSPANYPQRADSISAVSRKPNNEVLVGPSMESHDSDSFHTSSGIRKKRALTLGPTQSPRQLPKPDMHFSSGGDLAISKKKQEAHLNSVSETKVHDEKAVKELSELIDQAPRPASWSDKYKERLVDHSIFLETNSENKIRSYSQYAHCSASHTLNSKTKSFGSTMDDFVLTSDPIPPTRVKKYRSVSVGQQPIHSKVSDTHSKWHTDTYPGTIDKQNDQKLPVKETGPMPSGQPAAITDRPLQSSKQRSISSAGLLDSPKCDGDANTALHAKPRATTMYDMTVIDKSEILKGKKSPASPISPEAMKTKSVTRKNGREPKPKFLFTKRDESKPDKEVISPVKKEQEPQNEAHALETTSSKTVPSPQEVMYPKEAISPTEDSFSKEVTPSADLTSPTTAEPFHVVAESPTKEKSPEHETTPSFPEELLSPKDTPSPKEESLQEEVSSPKASASPKEVSSPKTLSSPTEITEKPPMEAASQEKDLPEEQLAEKLSFSLEKDQDSRDTSFQDASPSGNVPSHNEPKTDVQIPFQGNREKKMVPPVQKKPTEKKPVEKESLEKPSVIAKPKVEKPAAPKRGNVRANMALFEQKTTPAKPAVSDSSSASRAGKRQSLAGSQRSSFEEISTAKPDEKSSISNAQGHDTKKPDWKRPVSPPKERNLSAPVNVQDKSNTQDNEQSKEKPLSMKERLSKFQFRSSSSVVNAPLPWKARPNSNKEGSNADTDQQLSKESTQTQQAPDKRVDLEENTQKSETSVRRQSENEPTASDAGQDEKSNEEQPLSSPSCKNFSQDKEDNGSLSMSSNALPTKEEVDISSEEKQATTTISPISASKSFPKKHGFVPKTEHCIVCQRPVYFTEMGKAEGKTFHKGCQKCTECNRTLLIGNLLLVDSRIFCKLHGTQMKNKLLKMRLEIE